MVAVRQDDWEWARVQYETTDRMSADIAVDIGTRHTTLLGRAARHKWTRDKNARVVKETASLILAARQSEAEDKKQRFEIIERVNVEMQAKILAEHRTDIAKAKTVAAQLWIELEDNNEELDLKDRTNILKRLADTTKTFILLERQAFGIQGALQDPEDASTQSADAAQEGMALILAKFASVLSHSSKMNETSRGNETSKPKSMGDVIELTPVTTAKTDVV